MNENNKKDNTDFNLVDLINQNANETSEQYKLLKELISSDENLEMKTEITNPLYLAILKTYSEYLKRNKFDAAHSHVEYFIKQFLVYNVSKKRKSRAEIVEAFKQMSQNSLNEQPIPREV